MRANCLLVLTVWQPPSLVCGPQRNVDPHRERLHEVPLRVQALGMGPVSECRLQTLRGACRLHLLIPSSHQLPSSPPAVTVLSQGSLLKPFCGECGDSQAGEEPPPFPPLTRETLASLNSARPLPRPPHRPGTQRFTLQGVSLTSNLAIKAALGGILKTSLDWTELGSLSPLQTSFPSLNKGPRDGPLKETPILGKISFLGVY